MKVINQKTLDTHDIQLMDNGIMVIHNFDKREQTVEDQKKLIEIIGEMTGKKRIPMFHTFEEFSLPGKEVREFWASDATCLYSKADAFIATSVGQRIIGNFYMKIEKPTRPSKLFSDKTKAMEWLKAFI